MASITEKGIDVKTATEFIEELTADWSAIFGDQMTFDINTPQGQIISLLGLLLANKDNEILDVSRSLDIAQAKGQQLDDLASILAVFRRGATKTGVNAILTGVDNVVVPAGSEAQSVGGDSFVLQENVTISGGSGAGYFLAKQEGAIVVAAGELTTISTPVSGWEAVTNTNAGETGRDVETDEEFTRRYFNQIAIASVSLMDSVISGVQAIDEVVNVVGVENQEDYIQEIKGVDIAAHGFVVSVKGGSDKEIGEAIRKHKSLGSNTRIPLLMSITGTNDLLIPEGMIVQSPAASNSYGIDIYFKSIRPIQLGPTGLGSGAFYATTEGDFILEAGEVDTTTQSGVTAVTNDDRYRGVMTLIDVFSVDGTTLVQQMPIGFKRVIEETITLRIQLQKDSDYPIDGDQLIKERIVAYFNGTDVFVPDRFELDGLQIGEDVFASRIYTPINSVPGHSILSVEMDGKGLVNQSVIAINLDERATITEDDITII